MRRLLSSLFVLVSAVALTLAGAFAFTPFASAHSPAVAGAVYTETNAASGNAVIAFARARDGSLTRLGSYATGENGVGGQVDPLQSQYALILSQSGRWLFAVNAGSDTISSFAVNADGSLRLADTAPSGSVRPISLATHDDRVYVLNNGGARDNNHGTGNITGFRIASTGKLLALAGSTRPLSGSDVGASTIAFSRDGRYLLVSERVSNKLDLYTTQGDEVSAPSVTAAAANTPFGLSFARHDAVVVSEAGSQDASSYRVEDGSLAALNTEPTNGGAPCWAIVTPSGRFAYVANAGAGSLAGYAVANDGRLQPLASGFPTSTGAGSTPIDVESSFDGQYLYTLNTGSGAFGVFAIGADGALTTLPAVNAFPAASGYQGLAVR